MKVFISGGNGVLGKEMVKMLSSDHDVYAPSSIECNILDYDGLSDKILRFNPEIIIHLAGFIDTLGCEQNIQKAIDINVIGTINIVKTCLSLTTCKLVYISTDYVFGGERGNYTIYDRLNPINIYGKTKASSEYIVSILPNHQIIRAPFIGKIHQKAFQDQYTSRYFLEDVVHKIVNNIFNNSNQIIHISTSRMSIYQAYINKGLNPEPILINKEYNRVLPIDISLVNSSI